MDTTFFDRHSKVALFFSGGRDSIACLLLCRPFWDRISVVWVNAGNPYPETMAQMQRIAALVPQFIEVKGHQPEFIREHGHPVDVVPLGMTATGRTLARTAGPVVVPFTQCCNANLWQPGATFVRAMGYTGIIRGDKETDPLKPSVRSGETVNGIEHLFPLEAMSEAEVHAMVLESGLMPPHYLRGINTSLDCMNCTAYLEHNIERLTELRTTHPAVHAEVAAVLEEVKHQVRRYERAVATI